MSTCLLNCVCGERDLCFNILVKIDPESMAVIEDDAMDEEETEVSLFSV